MSRPTDAEVREMVAKAVAAFNRLSPEEQAQQRQLQRESYVRGMTTGCEHGVLDFETCPQCRAPQKDRADD